MILIVDGYNILKRQHGVRLIDDAMRRNFIHAIAAYARQSSNKVVLVFDGHPPENSTERYGHAIQVIYSGARETADDYIKRYITQHKTKDLMLVTSDRELNSIADRSAIPSLDAHEFMRVLRYSKDEGADNTRGQAPLIKMSEQESPELDELMESASKAVPQKSDDIVMSRERSTQKMSKKERELLKKVKKL